MHKLEDRLEDGKAKGAAEKEISAAEEMIEKAKLVEDVK
jgi:hypothetical protein